ncbi:MAG: AI-2E family transporter [Myxococcota bacterium]
MTPPRKTLNFLLGAAAFIVVIAGLQAARTLVLPFLFSIVLAIVVLPFEEWLERQRVPRAIAVLLSVFGVLGILFLVATLTGQSIQEFTNSLPKYEGVIRAHYAQLMGWVSGLGINLGINLSAFQSRSGSFDPNEVLRVVGATLNGVVDILSNTVLVTITMAFILAEASGFSGKLERAFPGGAHEQSARFEAFRGLIGSVQRYLLLKSLTSGLTGLLVGILTFIIGLDFFVLWGFLAFVLNYIPTIGSIVAAVPAVLLALIQLGPIPALLIVVGYLAINISIGNILEPRLMGDQLGLSPLVVFGSLVFWGWLWGPAGMLLSVPLTVVVQKVMIQRDETRWLAVLLGPNNQDPLGLARLRSSLAGSEE